MFNTTATLRHVTPLPSGVLASDVVQLLQNHEFFIQCDPHMTKYEAIATADDPKPSIPEDRNVTATSEPTCYRVTDRVHTLPAGLWDSDVQSTYEFIKVEKGIFVRIRSPLSVSMETLWEATDTEEGSSELVEDVVIKCPRLLVGTVKSTCEADWKGIHERITAKLRE